MQGDWPDADDHTAVSEPVTDGGEPECTDKLCSGEATFALWMGEKFSRVNQPPEASDLDDGDLAPYVCEECLPRYERLHGEHGEFVRPEERLVTDGGTDVVPVHLTKYPEDAELEVETDSDGQPVVTNHDELETIDTVYGLTRESVEEHGLERDIVTPGDVLWHDAFADIEAGDEYVLEELERGEEGEE